MLCVFFVFSDDNLLKFLEDNWDNRDNRDNIDNGKNGRNGICHEVTYNWDNKISVVNLVSSLF